MAGLGMPVALAGFVLMRLCSLGVLLAGLRCGSFGVFVSSFV